MKVNLPKQLITSALLLFFYLNLTQFMGNFANAQCPTTAADFSINCGSSASLVANPAFVSYTPVATPCSPAILTTPINVGPLLVNTFNSDDTYTTPINIGFPFSFYGNTYTTAIIQTNGIVGFGAFAYTGYSSFTIPTPALPNNYIAGFFADIDIRCGGTITYQTIGTTPNRRFVASYNNVAPYGGGSPTCSGTGRATFQIILNENNTFNVVISQLSANWNATTSGALATSGAENIDGTIAVVAPGRNSTDYPAIVPGNLDCYTYTAYLCNFIDWKDGVTVISTSPTFAVSPTATKTYTATWQCGPTTCPDPITITVTTPTLTLGTITNNSNCITPNGSIAFTTNFGDGTYTLSYLQNGTATTSSFVVAGGTGTLSGLDAGAYTNFSIPTPVGCSPILVGTTANITNPVAVTGTGVSICTGGSGSLTSTSGATSIAQGAIFNSGDLSATDPQWIRNTSTLSCTASAGANQYYDVFTFTVSANGTYIFDMCAPTFDAYAVLYQNTFNGATPCATPTNFITANDDGSTRGCSLDPQISASLVTGVTYYLVTTSYSSGIVGTYDWTYTSSPIITPGTTTTLTSGNLTNGDPDWVRGTTGTTCDNSAGTTHNYDVFIFTVPTTGDYRLDMCTTGANWDGFGSLYVNAFNGANPCGTPANFIANDDDGNSGGNCENDPSITATLTAGLTYYLITTSYFSGVTGGYGWTSTPLTTTPGGTISTSPGLQWYTTATGGAPIGTGTPFNPVGVAGSGLPNTATAGTTTFYLATAANPTCRTPVTYAITNAPTAPTSISNSTSGVVCTGGSSILTAVGGASGGGSVLTWYSGSCGGTFLGTGTSISVTPTITTTYYVRYEGGCGNSICVSTTITVNPVSTALTTIVVPAMNCPNSLITLIASGGIAGSGSIISWYTGANGTGTLIGTGASISMISPSATTTYYVRREGGICAASADTPVVVNVRAFIYAAGGATSTTYCADKDGWNHFYNASDQIIFSVNGVIGAGSVATINIKPTGTYYQSPNAAKTLGNCFSGDESFEMVRSWNFTLSGAPTGTYQVRFYYLPAERTDVEDRANAWRAATASIAPTNLTCTYSNKYGALATDYATNGFYWFKNTGSAYIGGAYDGVHLAGVSGTAGGGVNYVELIGITSFSGGSGAIVLVPLVPLPVTLLSFTGKRMTTNQVKISWETVQEIENAGFEVEMSADARNFEKIGFMTGQGNNKTVASYEMMHTNSVGGYFRLKQLDNNGRYAYSKIIYIEGTSESVIRIYPNPATDNLTIDLGQLKANESAKATFRNMLGVVVGEKNLSQVQTDIALGHLAKGIYILEINKNGKKIIEKVVLQ